MTIRPLVAGNWKMNGPRASLAVIGEIAKGYDAALRTKADLLVCPPATLLFTAAALCLGSRIRVGAQDCHANESGAHTGDIAAEMIADCGADYVIVGHSERRADHGGKARDDAVAGLPDENPRCGLAPQRRRPEKRGHVAPRHQHARRQRERRQQHARGAIGGPDDAGHTAGRGDEDKHEGEAGGGDGAGQPEQFRYGTDGDVEAGEADERADGRDRHGQTEAQGDIRKPRRDEIDDREGPGLADIGPESHEGGDEPGRGAGRHGRAERLRRRRQEGNRKARAGRDRREAHIGRRHRAAGRIIAGDAHGAQKHADRGQRRQHEQRAEQPHETLRRAHPVEQGQQPGKRDEGRDGEGHAAVERAALDQILVGQGLTHPLRLQLWPVNCATHLRKAARSIGSGATLYKSGTTGAVP